MRGARSGKNHSGYEFVGIGFTGKSAALEELGAVIYRDFDQLMAEGLDASSLKNGVTHGPQHAELLCLIGSLVE